MGNHEDPNPGRSYLSLVNLEKSSLNLNPRMIFLFGGEVDLESKAYKSVRHRLYMHILAKYQNLSNKLVMPEDFPDWINDGAYPDLLTFERDFAELPSLVILIPESPGSFAELGAFSVIETLQNNVILIVPEIHFEKSSFIKLGPIRLLDEEKLISLNFDELNPLSLEDDDLDQICKTIIEIERRQVGERQFNFNSNGHISMLIYELINIFRALKLTEIEEYLGILGAVVKRSTLKRLLFILEKSDHVFSVKRYNVDYYLPRKNENRINFSSKNPKKLFDKNKLIIGVAEYYKNNVSEEVRVKLIREKI